MGSMHKLIIGPYSGKTACGRKVQAFFPQTEMAMSFGPEMTADFSCCLDDGRVTCLACHSATASGDSK